MSDTTARPRSSGLTRRQLVGRTAVGAAAVWSAPAVTTLGLTPAAAASAGFCPVPTITEFEGQTTMMYAGQLPPGTNLTQNGAPFNSDQHAFVFNESGPVTIPAGGYQSETGLIPAGTIVCSLLVHGSPTATTQRFRGTLSVPPGSTIVGYDGRTDHLQNSDPLFAVPGVNYNGQARQHEWTANNANNNADFYGQLNATSAVIRMVVANCCIDQGRIFVTCP